MPMVREVMSLVPRPWRVVVAVVTVAALVSGCATSSDQPPAPRHLVVGTTSGALERSEAAVRRFEELTGVSPSMENFYIAFPKLPEDMSPADRLLDAGIVPMLSWEPWRPGRGTNQPEFALARIAGGAYDDQIAAAARELAMWGRPIYLRFAHEMNGNWYPWAESRNGNEPGSYADAFRHVHDVFAKAGATNVRWVWSVNIIVPNSPSLASLYPGGDYVDVVGVDGYNFGEEPSNEWRSPAEVFDTTLDQLPDVAPDKPVLLTEVASAESGGEKGEWIEEFFAYVASRPDVAGFVWFDIDKEHPWTIDSSGASRRSFASEMKEIVVVPPSS
jgi:hypothetical protein